MSAMNWIFVIILVVLAYAAGRRSPVPQAKLQQREKWTWSDKLNAIRLFGMVIVAGGLFLLFLWFAWWLTRASAVKAGYGATAGSVVFWIVLAIWYIDVRWGDDIRKHARWWPK